ncbi:MAG: FAD:protein FMN transferase [Rhodanobacter sp.]|nr:FAD:protein FMN transferase [Rhodanobacter sp.]
MRRLLTSISLLLLLAACARPQPVLRHEVRTLMGTQVEISAESARAEDADAAIDAAYAEMSRLSDMMNHYNPDSVVSAINREAGVQPVAVPPELMAVLHMAQDVSQRSGGAFDITVGSIQGWRFRADDPQIPTTEDIAAQLPLVGYAKLRLDPAAGTAYLTQAGTRIDLGGIAKLPILDAGLRVLRAHGITRALINGGGDIVAMTATGERAWRVGIRDPDAPERLRWTLDISNGFVSSSGDYERGFIKDGRRYHHILDPRTGYPTQGPRAVTLVGADLAQINGWSCAIMVAGLAAGQGWIEHAPGLAGLIVDKDGSVWVSDGLRTRLQPAVKPQ